MEVQGRAAHIRTETAERHARVSNGGGDDREEDVEGDEADKTGRALFQWWGVPAGNTEGETWW